MCKSNKRIKIEGELFSKSIEDIEKMFNLSYLEKQEPDEGYEKRKSPGLCLDQRENKKDPLGIDFLVDAGPSQPQGCLKNGTLCEDYNSRLKKSKKIIQPSIFQTSILSCWPDMEKTSLPLFHYKQDFLDLHIDEDIDYYNVSAYAKSYLPRLNLESDLKLIDQMFTKPLLKKAL